MSETIKINIQQDIFQQLKELKNQFSQLNEKVSGIEATSKKSFGSISSQLKAINFVSITQGLQNLTQGFKDLNAPGLSFQSQLAEVSAITGVTGKDLEILGKKARESAKEFGGTAAESLDSYKTILSRFGPDIGKNKEALALMEKNVRTLSKTMGGDAKGSVDALTTAMLQYGVDLSNPAKAQKEMARMMNVMAAGSKEGAAEVTSISEALKVSGVQAKQSKVSFEETNAALQSLAAGGKEGAEAGTAFRNVLGKMAGEDIIPKEAAIKLKALGVNMNIVSNTSLPFATRLKELKKAQADATVIAQVFGVENAAAANILLDSIDAQEKLTEKITGTNVANEQASVIMETHEEKMKRMQAAIDDAKISFFEASHGVTAYLEPMSQLSTTVSSFIPLISTTWKGVSKLGEYMRNTSGVINQFGSATSNASSMLSNLKSIAVGGLWTAIAVGAAAAAYQIYQIASGAEEAERNLKLLEQAKESGKNNSEYTTQQGDKAFDRAMRQLERERSAKEINDKEYLERKKKIAENQERYYKADISNINALIKSQKQLISEAQAKINYTLTPAGHKNKSLNEVTEIRDAASDQIKRSKLLLNQYRSELKGIKDPYEEATQKVLDAKAEIKGAGASKNTPLVSSKGYSDSTKTYSSDQGGLKNINIRINQLVGEISLKVTNVQEGTAEIKKQVTEALISAVRDTELSL